MLLNHPDPHSFWTTFFIRYSPTTYAMRNTILTLCLLLACLPAILARQTCYSTFSVNGADGCAPLGLIITSHVSNENPLYFFGDGSQPSDSPAHTYAQPGTYQLVRIITPSCASTVSDTIQITVYDSSPPVFEVDSCLNSANLHLTDTTFPWYQVWVTPPNAAAYKVGVFASGEKVLLGEPRAPYEVEVRGSTSDQETVCATNRRPVSPWQELPKPKIDSLSWADDGTLILNATFDSRLQHLLFEKIGNGSYNVISTELHADGIKLSDRNSDEEVRCYILGVISDCIDPSSITSASQIPTEQRSEPICHMPIKATPTDEAVQVSWDDYPEGNALVESYQLFKDGALLGTLEEDSNIYRDSSIICGSTYCYQLKTRLASGAIINGRSQCTKITQGRAVETRQMRAGWENDSLLVRWDLDTALVSNIQLFSLQGPLATGVEIPKGYSFPDTVSDFGIDSTACYYLEVQDICDNTSFSDTTCSIYLTAQQEAVGNVLEWSPFRGLDDDFHYLVETRENGAWEILEMIDRDETAYTHEVAAITKSTNEYRITARSTLQSSQTAHSNTIIRKEQIYAQLPDAFTPNADGLNDFFSFNGVRLSENAVMRIFNKLGIEVYNGTADDRGWNGEINNQQAPSGAYVYIIEGNDAFGGKFAQKGTLILLRP